MTSNQAFHRILKRNYKCSTDRLFAYFIGLIGISGMVYTYLQSNVIGLNTPDILYVDRETLEIEKGGRYAVLLKQTFDKESIPKSDKVSSANKSLHKDSINSSKNLTPNYNKFVGLLSGDIALTLNQNSTYQFVIKDTELKHMFRTDRRTLIQKQCNNLFEGDSNAHVDTLVYMRSHLRRSITNLRYNKMTSNCSTFKLERGYLDSPLTQIERDFPLAYSIIAYKNVEQIERLLRAIYRPQNFYCVHLDKKTTVDDVTTMTSITDCFPNVFMSSRSIDVRWGEFSVLEAELVCMKDLLSKKGWKYFINLTGQEFPLKTNLEIVKILKVLKGANLVDGTWVRARKNYFYRWTKSGKSPPHNIRPIKGSVHVCINRDFVDFALNDYRSKDFLEWLKDTEIPDETFFASLNHNPHLNIPGSFLGKRPLSRSVYKYDKQ